MENLQVTSQLGIHQLYTENANFTAFSKTDPLKVDALKHKATIEVNEEGTVAAAVSSLIAVRSGPAIPLYFVCNRPFVFLIRHKLTRTTLFAGVVRHPRDIEVLP